MPNDLLNRDSFGLLPEPEGRWGSFGVSMITNICLMSLLILLTAAVHKVDRETTKELRCLGPRLLSVMVTRPARSF